MFHGQSHEPLGVAFWKKKLEQERSLHEAIIRDKDREIARLHEQINRLEIINQYQDRKLFPPADDRAERSTGIVYGPPARGATPITSAAHNATVSRQDTFVVQNGFLQGNDLQENVSQVAVVPPPQPNRSWTPGQALNGHSSVPSTMTPSPPDNRVSRSHIYNDDDEDIPPPPQLVRENVDDDEDDDRIHHGRQESREDNHGFNFGSGGHEEEEEDAAEDEMVAVTVRKPKRQAKKAPAKKAPAKKRSKSQGKKPSKRSKSNGGDSRTASIDRSSAEEAEDEVGDTSARKRKPNPKYRAPSPKVTKRGRKSKKQIAEEEKSSGNEDEQQQEENSEATNEVESGNDQVQDAEEPEVTAQESESEEEEVSADGFIRDKKLIFMEYKGSDADTAIYRCRHKRCFHAEYEGKTKARDHNKIHAYDARQMFQCNDCGLGYKTQQKMDAHRCKMVQNSANGDNNSEV